MNSQICEVMEFQITGKRKKGQPRKSWEECINKDLERYGLSREDAYDPQIRWDQIKIKFGTPASWDNGIETIVVLLLL